MSESATPELRDAITSAIAENPVILFMKGNPDAPACGFSARTVSVLNRLDTAFAAVDILPDPRIRQELSAVSGWPTIPQLFVDGVLVGGSDIVLEMFESGELATLLGAEGDAAAETTGTPDLSQADAASVLSSLGAETAPVSIENRL